MLQSIGSQRVDKTELLNRTELKQLSMHGCTCNPVKRRSYLIRVGLNPTSDVLNPMRT